MVIEKGIQNKQVLTLVSTLYRALTSNPREAVPLLLSKAVQLVRVRPTTDSLTFIVIIITSPELINILHKGDDNVMKA